MASSQSLWVSKCVKKVQTQEYYQRTVMHCVMRMNLRFMAGCQCQDAICSALLCVMCLTLRCAEHLSCEKNKHGRE